MLERTRKIKDCHETSWGQNKLQMLTLGTIPLKEPSFVWIDLEPSRNSLNFLLFDTNGKLLERFNCGIADTLKL